MMGLIWARWPHLALAGVSRKEQSGARKPTPRSNLPLACYAGGWDDSWHVNNLTIFLHWFKDNGRESDAFAVVDSKMKGGSSGPKFLSLRRPRRAVRLLRRTAAVAAGAYWLDWRVRR